MSPNFQQATLVDFLSIIPDPRIDRQKKYPLIEIFVEAIVAVMCGAETWNEIAEDAEDFADWIRENLHLELKNGTPSHDTFRRVFSILDPNEFAKAFCNWMSHVQTWSSGKVVPIDGKTLRHSFETNPKDSHAAIHMVGAWVNENGGVSLGQIKSEGKSNEITTIPKLLELLRIRGCTVTTDAMGCQVKIAQKILEKGANYVLAVKDNQETLHQEIQNIFIKAEQKKWCLGAKAKQSDYETIEAKHGRQEIRVYKTLSTQTARRMGVLNLGNRFPKLNSITRVQSIRKNMHSKSPEQISTRFYISSLHEDARQIGAAIREHWGIENQLHWTLDVTFREDESRIRKLNSPENFAMIRRLVLNILRAYPDPRKRSIRRKRHRCDMNPTYRLNVLLNQCVAAI